MRHVNGASRALSVVGMALTGLIGCGGQSSDGDGPGTGGSLGTGGSSGGGSNAGGSNAGGSNAGGSSSGGSSSGGSSTSACPAAVPTSGTDCASPDNGTGFLRATCSYGDDPRPECRRLALCIEAGWQVTEPDPSRCSEPPLPSACPAAPPPVGSECSSSALGCWYEDGTRCTCSPCSGGSEYPICQTIDPPQWACGAIPAGCPNPLPQAGASCDTPDLSCGPSCEQPIRCRDDVWVYEQASCPICAGTDTPIATPTGVRPISELGLGELVYSIEGAEIVVVPVVRIGSTPVARHHVVRVRLDDGAELEMSPGHPTVDGGRFSDLAPGDRLDEEHVVVSTDRVPYRDSHTYDILPGSSSGVYFAGGVAIPSTLAPAR